MQRYSVLLGKTQQVLVHEMVQLFKQIYKNFVPLRNFHASNIVPFNKNHIFCSSFFKKYLRHSHKFLTTFSHLRNNAYEVAGRKVLAKRIAWQRWNFVARDFCFLIFCSVILFPAFKKQNR